ncbi:MAG: phospho-N-acetylmuramoyl-pentapeptide-transferase, partial [Gorillibacterium sp.]|nr:phospho-N-acetylmuramoyl-pentapeptide-transferase [Gorillibacterium sp.]
MELKEVLFPLGVAFILALLVGPLVIPILRRLKFGQQIRSDGPQGHLKKKGTPTMGGMIILLALSLSALRFSEINKELIILLVATLGFGLIGFLDDYIKIVFKRSLGLTALQKLIGQLLVAAAVCVLLIQNGHSTDIGIPYTHITLAFGWFYYLLIVLMMLGMSNAVNFTDGLDGLLSGTAAISFGAFVV